MKKSLKLSLGLALAGLAFVGVVVLGQVTKPPTYEVVVVVEQLPPFTELTAEKVQLDVQSLSAAVADKYILRAEWEEILAAGRVVAVEPLQPGQPLMRTLIATGANAEKVKRLSVAITDPQLTIIGVPVKPQEMPAVYPGDALALYFSAGQIQAQSISTAVVTLPSPTPDPQTGAVVTNTTIIPPAEEPTTKTLELNLPLTKRLATGLVYRLNREQTNNPNYGAPGTEQEPRYLAGEVTSLDLVVHRDAAEWIAFALAHGQVQIAVLPAVAIPQLQDGTLPASPGATWSDLADLFFTQRLGQE